MALIISFISFRNVLDNTLNYSAHHTFAQKWLAEISKGNETPSSREVETSKNAPDTPAKGVNDGGENAEAPENNIDAGASVLVPSSSGPESPENLEIGSERVGDSHVFNLTHNLHLSSEHI
jgi:hypothetical protein